MQLGVFGFGLLENWDVGIGFFPCGKKILIRSSRFGGVTCKSVSARLANSGKAIDWIGWINPAMIENLLVFGCSFLPVMSFQVGLATDVISPVAARIRSHP